jgi:hypothetical protein
LAVEYLVELAFSICLRRDYGFQILLEDVARRSLGRTGYDRFLSGRSWRLHQGLIALGGTLLVTTMFFATLTHVFVLHTSPIPAIVLGLLNALIVYLRRDEVASFTRILAKVF